MDEPGIRETIDAALASETRSHLLRGGLERRLPELQVRLLLPDEAPVDALMLFISRYVQSVPSCLRLVTAVSKRLGFFEYAAPFLHMAEDYFLQPPEEFPQDGGLKALLDEAFLAHRLLEEVNDHHIRHMQRPLLPGDMTEANIIVHHLLGDELASRIEGLVQFTASGLMGREHVWESVRDLPGISGQQSFSQHPAQPVGNIRLRLAS
jgi:hypothetical protein